MVAPSTGMEAAIFVSPERDYVITDSVRSM